MYKSCRHAENYFVFSSPNSLHPEYCTKSWRNFNLKLETSSFHYLSNVIYFSGHIFIFNIQFYNHRWIKKVRNIFVNISDLIWNQIFLSFRPSFTQCDLLRILKRCGSGKLFWRLGRKFSWLKSFPFIYWTYRLDSLTSSTEHSINCIHMVVCEYLLEMMMKNFFMYSPKEWRRRRRKWKEWENFVVWRFKESFLLLPFFR